MSDSEIAYLEAIFKAIPHMSDFEKGRLLGVAEEMERQRARLEKYQEALSALSLKDGSNPLLSESMPH